VNDFRRPMSLNRCAKNLLLAACGCALFNASALANPAEEITRAAAVNGVTDVAQASPRQFVKAFTAVALRTQPRDLPNYVVAAIDLRPDLAPRVVGVAVRATVKNSEGKAGLLCLMVERIIRAGIAACPEGAVSIAKAGSSAAPELRRCVIDAAVSATPDKKSEIVQAATTKAMPFAFLTFSASEINAFSFSAATLNPANLSSPNDNGAVASPEQPPSH